MWTLIAMLALTPPAGGEAPAGGAGAPAPVPCSCTQARVQHGWCDACSVGFVATFRVESKELYEAIHPHGHDIQADLMRCQTCRAAVPVNGWCGECNSGFVARQAYFSRLTYLLAKGSVGTPTASTCRACRICSQRSGWCEACSAGWVGNVRFEDRATFAVAAQQLEVFFNAREAAQRCELCATAMILDAWCPFCRVSYRDGAPQTRPAAVPNLNRASAPTP